MGVSLAFMLLAVPAGKLADRVGRGRVFVGGYVLLLPVYASLLAPQLGYLGLGLVLALVGASYAATDGVLAALASGTLDEEARGSGLSVLDDGDEPVALRGLGRVRRAVDVGGPEHGGPRVRDRARGGDRRDRGGAARHPRGGSWCVAARAPSRP